MAHHTGRLHAGHPPVQHLGLPGLQLLLAELLPDIEAERHRAVILMAALGMVAAEGNELPADRAPAGALAFAALGMMYNPLHLLAGRQWAVGIPALAS